MIGRSLTAHRQPLISCLPLFPLFIVRVENPTLGTNVRSDQLYGCFSTSAMDCFSLLQGAPWPFHSLAALTSAWTHCTPIPDVVFDYASLALLQGRLAPANQPYALQFPLLELGTAALTRQRAMFQRPIPSSVVLAPQSSHHTSMHTESSPCNPSSTSPSRWSSTR